MERDKKHSVLFRKSYALHFSKYKQFLKSDFKIVSTVLIYQRILECVKLAPQH